ncbi:EthD domain-containing protein [Amylocarpus encephaloides]|uniref:EthD domain-containing protein n=1 Tax=Amylocarpus encephaloides TaxID=45428 RepID=A0A9P7YCT3_9HELO|nr:EthD domain-containing protein [Amylocarpus encephaloides]
MISYCYYTDGAKPTIFEQPSIKKPLPTGLTIYPGDLVKMMNTEPLIRITVCVNRKPGTTEEEFNQYWANQHGPLASEWLLRCGILRYVQYHTTSEHKNLAKKMSGATGRPILNYDGMGDFWVKKFEDFEAAFLDPEYQEKIRPDELKLIDMDSVAVTVGVEYVTIDDGKINKEHLRIF